MIGKYVTAAAALAFGGVLLWHNHTAPSTPVLLTSAGSVLLGGLLIDPADVKAALASLAGLWTARRGGG